MFSDIWCKSSNIEMYSLPVKQMAIPLKSLCTMWNVVCQRTTSSRMDKVLINAEVKSEGGGPEVPSECVEYQRAEGHHPDIEDQITETCFLPTIPQASSKDGSPQPLPEQMPSSPAEDGDLGRRKRLMLQEMDRQRVGLQLKLLEAKLQKEHGRKNQEANLEQQRIQDLTAALSQHRVFENQNTADFREDSNFESACPHSRSSPDSRVAAYAVPFTLTAVGFTSSGIAAKSMAAYMMKCSAVYSAGGVPAGGAVATLQSLGAKAGISYLNGAIGGTAVYYKLKGSKKADGTKKD
ncbi:uncharacterized protein [Ambystoma mexicanum]|uniref:uncharacterized protein isoform X3 n=1 Tax=Ambystoma mexicanum TaxID=8296 RepID=UPI0037E8261D